MASTATNAFFQTFAKIFGTGLYAIFGLLLARFVTQGENGVYTLMSTLLFFGSLASNFGVPFVAVRAIARDRSRSAEVYVDTRTAVLIGAFLAFFIPLLWVVFEMNHLGHWDGRRIVLSLLVCGIILFEALGSLGDMLFQAHEDMRLSAVFEAASGLFRAGGATLAVVLLPPEWKILGVYTVFLLGSAVRGFFMPILARRRFLPGELPAISYARSFALLKEAYFLAVFRMLRMLRNRVDSLLLGLLISGGVLGAMEAADVSRALYAQAMRVVIIFNTLSVAFNTALFPRMVRLTNSDSNRTEARVTYFRAIRVQSWWAIPLACGLWFYADGIAALFGPQYLEGIPALGGSTGDVLRVLAFAMMVDVIGGPIGLVILGVPGMDRKLPKLGGMLAAVSVVLNVVLIPRFGIMGAAYASLGAACFEFFLKLTMVARILGSPAPMLKIFAPFVFISVLMLYGLQKLGFRDSVFLGPLLGAIFYFAVSILSRSTDPKINDVLRRKILRRK